MPPRTRAQGPPEGGHQVFQEPQRKRKPKAQPKPKPQPKPQGIMSPAAAPALTMPPVQTPRKRLREGNDDVTERALKRVNTEPRPAPRPASSPFLFSSDRGRSQLTPGRNTASITRNRRLAQSARKPVHTQNPFDISANEMQAAFPKAQEKDTNAPAPAPMTETPTKQSGFVGRFFGSIRKTIFGGSVEESARGSESPTPQTNPFEAAPIAPRRAAQASRLSQLAKETPKPKSSSVPASDMQPTVEDSVESPSQAEHDLQTTEVPGSRKRKLDSATEERPVKKPMLNADENGQITGSFGLTDEDLEYSDDDEPTDEPAQQEKPAEKEQPVQKATATETEQMEALKTPSTLGLDNFEPSFTNRGKMLRSAMKSKPNATGKKVGFKSDLTSERTFYRDLGPAGHYTGTLFNFGDPRTPEDTSKTFDDASPMSLDTQSTTTPSDIDKGRTINNTYRNRLENQIDVAGAVGGGAPWWEKTPTEPAPVITNKSGHFSVPDLDDSPTQDEPEEPATAPSAPKIPHASLPATDERLNKARQEAQQYKPKQSSRLSNVEPARSRSTSPSPTTTANIMNDEAEKMREAEEWAAGLDWPKPQPYPDLEAEEKMREAEEWAANLNWPKPQTYVEAGLCSPYIDQLLRDRWNKEDDRLTHDFWTKEFQEVNSMMNAAKAAGRKLELVYEED